MKSVCIACNKKYSDKEPLDNRSMSHGLCPSCLKITLIPLYRRRQLKEGNFDCYGKAIDYCDQFRCSYRMRCIR